MMGGCASGFQLSARMRHRAPHLGRRLVLAQSLIDDLAQQIVVGPGQKLDLGHQLRPHPMHAAEHQGRSEATGARRRDLERHLIDRKRLQPTPQPLQLGLLDAGAGAAGIDQPSVRKIIWRMPAQSGGTFARRVGHLRPDLLP